MKLFSLVSLVLAFTSADSFARSIQRDNSLVKGGIYSTELTLVSQEGNTPIESIEATAINVDLKKRELTLTMYRRFHCPDAMVCAQVMPAPRIVRLPIVSIKKDACNARIIVAKQDKRPVDGLFEQVSVVDNRAMNCLTLMFVPATQVSYEYKAYSRMDASEIHAEYTFTGNRLVRTDGPMRQDLPVSR